MFFLQSEEATVCVHAHYHPGRKWTRVANESCTPLFIVIAFFLHLKIFLSRWITSITTELLSESMIRFFHSFVFRIFRRRTWKQEEFFVLFLVDLLMCHKRIDQPSQRENFKFLEYFFIDNSRILPFLEKRIS